MLSRRKFLSSAAFFAAVSGRGWGSKVAAAARPRVFRPEDFGAKGDGKTNDSAAFAALSQAVTDAGGGVIKLRKVTYVVGAQGRADGGDGTWLYAPGKLLELEGCTGPLTIKGGGARLLCADGLRYGTFDLQTGEPRANAMPYTGPGRATPYTAMIQISNCTGPVEISDLELDGNSGAHKLGGGFGDTGFQIPSSGLFLRDNKGSEVVRNVFAHHHGLDGLYLDGVDRDLADGQTRLISDFRSEYNGRQGCSIIGGRGYRFERCAFSHTGKGKIQSAPGAGVDFEPEGKAVRDLAFDQCEFSDNSGCGMVADNGDSEGVRFVDCTFVGTTNWSIWPKKPHFRFERCTFVGSLVNTFGDDDPARAVQFAGCTFSDDPARSPTGKVYLGQANGPIADLWTARNILFDGCRFELVADAVLPWTRNVIYRDCRMRQSAAKVAYPRGKYLGTNEITGNVDLAGSSVTGTLQVNGQMMKPGVIG